MSRYVILTAPDCPWCERAKKLLSEMHYSYTEIDITEHPGIRTFMSALDLRTVPQVFDRHVRVGGYTELAHMFGEPLET